MSSTPDPAHDEAMEAAYLGAILLGADVESRLELHDFFLEPNRLIFQACTQLKEKGEPVDLLTVSHLLRDRNQIELAGGATYLSSLVDALPDVANVEAYEKVIKEAAVRRSLQAFGSRIQNVNGRPVRESIEQVRRELEHIAARADLKVSHEEASTVLPLQELFDQPELLVPPAAIVPGLLFEGRSSLLASSEKTGKSTLLRKIAAEVSRAGHLAGLSCKAGRVLAVFLEESVSDVVRGLYTAGADPKNVFVVFRLPSHDTPELRTRWLAEIVKKYEIDVVLIDTLIQWGAAYVTDWKDGGQTTRVVTPLTNLAHDLDVGVLIAAHGRKSDGRYRDSSGIAAAVDLLIEMLKDDKDRDVRRFEPTGRMYVSEFSLRWTGDGYEQAGENLSVRDRVFGFIKSNPGSSTRSIRKSVQGKTALISSVIKQLESDKLIENRPDDRGSRFYLIENTREPVGTGREPVRDSIENPMGTEREPVGNHSGTGEPVPSLYIEGGTGHSRGGDSSPKSLNSGAPWEAQ